MEILRVISERTAVIPGWPAVRWPVNMGSKNFWFCGLPYDRDWLQTIIMKVRIARNWGHSALKYRRTSAHLVVRRHLQAHSNQKHNHKKP